MTDNEQSPPGRDVIHGDRIAVGSMSNVAGVAIGTNARAEINHYTEIIVKLDTIEDVPPAPGEPPYKGLAYFTEKDADIYYGRKSLSHHVVARLNQQHFLALIGASGSGKSSLLRASIIPQLREQNWLIHLITPGAHPLDALTHSLGREEESLDFAPELGRKMLNDTQTLYLAGSKFASRAEAPGLLIAVDQFEEIFTQCQDAQERQAFVENLLTAANKQGVVTILISMRADFYDRCAQFEGLREHVSQQQEFIGPMKQDELVRIIAEPAKRGGWQFVEGLVEQILEDAGQEPGHLPLLSHALRETWERRRGTIMTLAGYRAAGGVEGAIAKTAEETLKRLEQQDTSSVRTAQSIFLSLTELGEGSEDTRRIADLQELETANPDGNLDTVLETLAAARLITIDEKQVEVAHEALIRRWPRLHNWLADNRERLRFERQLTADAAEWQDLGEDAGALYRGARLQQAIEWSEQSQLHLVELSAQFLQASQEAAEQEIREKEAQQKRELKMTRELAESQTAAAQRLRWAVWALGGAAIAMLIIIGILIAPFIQERWARSAANGEMAMIPAGSFTFGKSEPTFVEFGSLVLATWPEQEVTLPQFFIDKYEVTNRQYYLCAQYSDNCNDPVENANWIKDPEKRSLPVVNVTLMQARNYCQWIGKRLPTEAEWERAARGTSHYWPWGNEDPTADLVNAPLDTDPNQEGNSEPVTLRNAGTSLEGVYNLVGNVWEWTSSYWQSDKGIYDPQQVWDGSLENYSSDQYFALRGGGWYFGIPHIAVAFPASGSDHDVEIGIRCASDVPR